MDVLGLMGDSVDNVPGAPGIGGKGARDLVLRFGSLEALLDRSEQVSRKTYRESLQNHREQILQSKDLVTIDTAVPIDFSWETLQAREPDPDQLRPLLAQLGFQSMLKEMEGGAAPARAKAPRIPAPGLPTPASDSAGAGACGFLLHLLAGNRPGGFAVPRSPPPGGDGRRIGLDPLTWKMGPPRD